MPAIPLLIAFAFVSHSTHASRERAGQALLSAAWVGNEKVVKSILLKHGNVNYRGIVVDPRDKRVVSTSTTALIIAAERGDLKLTRCLVSKGARLNIRDEDGNTALHQATDEGHIEIVRLLLANGADYRIKNHFGFTPYDLTDRPDNPAPEACEPIARLIEQRMARDRRTLKSF